MRSISIHCLLSQENVGQVQEDGGVECAQLDDKIHQLEAELIKLTVENGDLRTTKAKVLLCNCTAAG